MATVRAIFNSTVSNYVDGKGALFKTIERRYYADSEPNLMKKCSKFFLELEQVYITKQAQNIQKREDYMGRAYLCGLGYRILRYV